MSFICKRCGTQFNSPFCPNCGAPAPQQLNNQPPQQMPPPIMPQPLPFQPNQLGQPIQRPQKRINGFLVVVLITLGFFIFLGTIGDLLSNGNDKGTTSNNTAKNITASETPTPDPYIKVTSTDLIASYKDNQVKCKQLYDNQLLEVTGKVQSVGTDILNNTYVCLGSDSEFTFVGIQCYAKDKVEINKIAELKEGDVITVRGKGDCGSLSFSLEKAEIVE